MNKNKRLFLFVCGFFFFSLYCQTKPQQSSRYKQNWKKTWHKTIFNRGNHASITGAAKNSLKQMSAQNESSCTRSERERETCYSLGLSTETEPMCLTSRSLSFTCTRIDMGEKSQMISAYMYTHTHTHTPTISGRHELAAAVHCFCAAISSATNTGLRSRVLA